MAVHAERSARRVTVRAACNNADSAVPPGSTKEFSFGRFALYSSHQASKRSTYGWVIRSGGY